VQHALHESGNSPPAPSELLAGSPSAASAVWRRRRRSVASAFSVASESDVANRVPAAASDRSSSSRRRRTSAGRYTATPSQHTSAGASGSKPVLISAEARQGNSKSSAEHHHVTHRVRAHGRRRGRSSVGRRPHAARSLMLGRYASLPWRLDEIRLASTWRVAVTRSVPTLASRSASRRPATERINPAAASTRSVSSDHQPAPVGRVDLATQVTPHDKGVDQLTSSLLRNTQSGGSHD
jgi:hypothetical protein